MYFYVAVLPSQPFFLDELGNKVERRIGPYHEGDTLVLSCLVIGGKVIQHNKNSLAYITISRLYNITIYSLFVIKL